MTRTINRRAALGLLAVAPAAARAAARRELTVFEARRFITMEPARPA